MWTKAVGLLGIAAMGCGGAQAVPEREPRDAPPHTYPVAVTGTADRLYPGRAHRISVEDGVEGGAVYEIEVDADIELEVDADGAVSAFEVELPTALTPPSALSGLDPAARDVTSVELVLRGEHSYLEVEYVDALGVEHEVLVPFGPYERQAAPPEPEEARPSAPAEPPPPAE